MPEILQPHILSRGNGILESTTFLAAILGTVTGGLLSFVFRHQEVWIGVVLLVLSLIGAAASFLIARLPSANPTRPFPSNLFKPLWDNLKVLAHSRPLALAVLGIAFFIFMVSYMRATMYMHGQTRNPRWDEFHTSWVVATVALGVGFGAPLAGYLSGGKVELGLVPLGCVGMMLATSVAGLVIQSDPVLIAALIVIGFFSGFYMVPLYTLLQHRAPKATKGDLVATSNFINVTGAMAASVLFYCLVQLGIITGVTPEVPQKDHVAVGALAKLEMDSKGRPKVLRVKTEEGERSFFAWEKEATGESKAALEFIERALDLEGELIDMGEVGFFDLLSSGLKEGDPIIVSGYEIRKVRYINVRAAGQPLKAVYDNEALPRYLFIGAALMTLGILYLLVRKLPDFFVRTLFWRRCLGRVRIRAVNMHNLPTNGPVILASNCDRLESALHLVSATDRATTIILVEEAVGREGAPLLRKLAERAGLVEVPAGSDDPAAWSKARAAAQRAFKHGDLLAVTVNGLASAGVDHFLDELRGQQGDVPVIPVYCGALDGGDIKPARIRVVFGEPAAAHATSDDLRRGIDALGEWIRHNDHLAGEAH